MELINFKWEMFAFVPDFIISMTFRTILKCINTYNTTIPLHILTFLNIRICRLKSTFIIYCVPFLRNLSFKNKHTSICSILHVQPPYQRSKHLVSELGSVTE